MYQGWDVVAGSRGELKLFLEIFKPPESGTETPVISITDKLGFC